MIRCNNCYTLFDNDDDLTIMLAPDSSLNDKPEPDFIKGCPHCKTDEFLMDLD